MEILIGLIAILLFDLAVWFWAVDSRDLGLTRSDRPARAI